AVRSATVGRDSPRSTWERKPTERSMRVASSPRVTFLCLRRSRMRIARPSISSCLSMWELRLPDSKGATLNHIPQAVIGLARSLQRRRQQRAAREARIADGLVEIQQVVVTENRIAHCPGPGQGGQHAVAGEAL